MKRYNILFFITLFAILTFTTGCRPTKATVASGASYASDNQRYNEVVEKYSDWKTITTAGRMNIAMGSSFSSSIHLRMIKDKSISISLRPMFGIELARIFINVDSVYIVDKFHKMYLAEKITEITGGLPVEIGGIQNIILNRGFVIGAGEMTKKTKNLVTITEQKELSTWMVTPKSQLAQFIYSFIFNYSNELTTLNIKPQDAVHPIEVKYKNFSKSEAGNIASSIYIATSLKDKKLSLDVNIDASKLRCNTVFEESIEIDPSYKRISASAIPSILNSL